MNYYIGMDIKDFDMGSAVIENDYKVERARRFRAAKEHALRVRTIRLRVLTFLSFVASFLVAFSFLSTLPAVVAGIVGGVVLSIIVANMDFMAICMLAAYRKRRATS